LKSGGLGERNFFQKVSLPQDVSFFSGLERDRVAWFRFARALCANFVLYPALVVLSLAAVGLFPCLYLCCKLFLGWPDALIARLVIWLFGRGWITLVRVFFPVRIHNAAAHTLRRPCILVFNHLSAFDLFSMGILPVFDVAMAVKAWPFRMFWFAPFMRMARYLDIERLAPEALLAQCREIIDAKGRLLFFPEGRRSRDGKLQRFHSGAFKLAIELGVGVVPICIAGADALLPPGRFWLAPAAVRLDVLERIDPRRFSGELAHIELRKHVKASMAQHLSRMQETIL